MSVTGQTEAGGMVGEWMCGFGPNPVMAVTVVFLDVLQRLAPTFGKSEKGWEKATMMSYYMRKCNFFFFFDV